MRITLTNDFHGTETTLRVTSGRITARQVKRARARLCGSVHCTCSFADGARGPQRWKVDVHPEGYGVVVDQKI